MDNAHKQADEKLAEMERHLTKIYEEASAGISRKWQDYIKEVGERLTDLQKKYDEAKLSGKQDEIRKTGMALQREKKLKTVMNQRFKRLTEAYARRLLKVNEIAQAYINGQLPSVYVLGYNDFGTVLSKTPDNIISGYTFETVDEQTVMNLVTKDDSLLPLREVDAEKDIKYNIKQVNSQVLQGILQGEDMTKIGERLFNVTGSSLKAAIRDARTSVTSAENKGRLDSYKKAQDDGIILKKRWLATKGGRTRKAHQKLNGQTADIDKPFTSILGDIMFPGDPNAKPANVYNCRCTLVTEISGFKKRG